MRRLLLTLPSIALVLALLSSSAGAQEAGGEERLQTPPTRGELIALLGDYVPPGEDAATLAEQGEADRARRNDAAEARGITSLAVPRAPLEEMLVSRRSVGLSDDRDQLLKLLDDPAMRAPGDVDAYGLVLTRSELAELDTRLQVQDLMYLIYEHIMLQMPPEHFAGLWVEQGTTYIGVTADRERYEEDLRALFPLPDRVRVILQERSGVILERFRLDIREELLGNVDEVEPVIVSSMIDEKANEVVLGVDGDVNEVQRFYDSRFGENYVRVVQEAPEVAARNVHRTPSRGGLLIGRTAAADESCTSSFIGRVGSTRYLMTAGHCAAGVNLPMIFQGQIRINPLERVNVGSINGNPRADVGIVNLVPALWSSFVLADAGDRSHVIRRSHGLNAVQGGAVQIALGRSNLNVLATVINVDRDVTVTSPAYPNYQLIDTKRVDRAAVGGDSGSPVFQADIAEGVIVTDAGTYVQIINQLGGAGLAAVNEP